MAETTPVSWLIGLNVKIKQSGVVGVVIDASPHAPEYWLKIKSENSDKSTWVEIWNIEMLGSTKKRGD